MTCWTHSHELWIPAGDEGQNGSVQSAPVNPRCEDAIRRQLQLKKAIDTGVAQVSQEAGLERLIQPPWRPRARRAPGAGLHGEGRNLKTERQLTANYWMFSVLPVLF